MIDISGELFIIVLTRLIGTIGCMLGVDVFASFLFVDEFNDILILIKKYVNIYFYLSLY
jgi:hypothetical protein